VRADATDTCGRATTSAVTGIVDTPTVLSHASMIADGSPPDSWHGEVAEAVTPTSAVVL
jgi:hypothetical protein